MIRSPGSISPLAKVFAVNHLRFLHEQSEGHETPPLKIAAPDQDLSDF